MREALKQVKRIELGGDAVIYVYKKVWVGMATEASLQQLIKKTRMTNQLATISLGKKIKNITRR